MPLNFPAKKFIKIVCYILISFKAPVDTEEVVEDMDTEEAVEAMAEEMEVDMVEKVVVMEVEILVDTEMEVAEDTEEVMTDMVAELCLHQVVMVHLQVNIKYRALLFFASIFFRFIF